MFALYGDIPFELVGSPESFVSTLRFGYAEHPVVESKPLLQWVGDGLERLELEMLFHASFTNPTLQLDALIAAAEDHLPRPLVFGNGEFRGFFVTTELASEALQHAGDGTTLAIRVRAELCEWAFGAELSSILAQPASPPIAVTSASPALPGASAISSNPFPAVAAGPIVLFSDVLAATIVRSA